MSCVCISSPACVVFNEALEGDLDDMLLTHNDMDEGNLDIIASEPALDLASRAFLAGCKDSSKRIQLATTASGQLS